MPPRKKPVKYSNFPRGLLRLGVGCARGIRKDELLGLGKSDPYAKIIFGPSQAPQEFQTETDKNAGGEPYWGEWFTMPVTVPNAPENNMLVVLIFNENHLRSDNQIGYCRFSNLAEIVMSCKNFTTGDVWHTVYDPNTQLARGEIMLTFKFELMSDGEFETWVSDQSTAKSAQQPLPQASGLAQLTVAKIQALRMHHRASRVQVA